MTRICEKFNKKNLPYGSCKKKIGYFPTLGGGGGVSDKVGKFQLFFFEPFPKTEPIIFAQHTLVEVYLDLDDLWHF